MKGNIKEILEKSKKYGWVLEPDAKKILKYYGINSPEFIFSDKYQEIEQFFKKLNNKVVCKVVSPEIVHKSDSGGVIVGIDSVEKLKDVYNRLMKLKGAIGIIAERMVEGIELIVGGKNDEQFGPVILTGLGGVSVEIYKDNSIRMAPVNENEVEEMLKELKCYPILKGYRGLSGINMENLKKLIINFSNMLIDLEEYFESIDLNPVICNKKECFVCDARIMLLK